MPEPGTISGRSRDIALRDSGTKLQQSRSQNQSISDHTVANTLMARVNTRDLRAPAVPDTGVSADASASQPQRSSLPSTANEEVSGWMTQQGRSVRPSTRAVRAQDWGADELVEATAAKPPLHL
jgi:hypothetical protein